MCRPIVFEAFLTLIGIKQRIKQQIGKEIHCGVNNIISKHELPAKPSRRQTNLSHKEHIPTNMYI